MNDPAAVHVRMGEGASVTVASAAVKHQLAASDGSSQALARGLAARFGALRCIDAAQPDTLIAAPQRIAVNGRAGLGEGGQGGYQRQDENAPQITRPRRTH